MRLNDDKKADLLYAFFLSIVFVIIDYAVLELLVYPLHRFVPIQNPTAEDIVHIVIISVIGTLLGCLAFLAFKTRRYLVPKAYAFFPIYILVCLCFVYFNIDAENKAFAIEMILLYTLSPTIIGILISRFIYALGKEKSPE